MKYLRDIDFSGKSVLLRLDLNTPIDSGKVSDNERIVRSLKTIEFLADQSKRLIIISHLGRPQENNEIQPEYSLKPVAEELSNLIAKKVDLAESLSDIDETNSLTLLENVRFLEGEKSNNDKLAKTLSSLADVVVFDAFATSHRAHASTSGIISHSKEACAGYLIEEELYSLNKAFSDSKRPFVAVIGGSKVSTKLGLLQNSQAQLRHKIGYILREVVRNFRNKLTKLGPYRDTVWVMFGLVSGLTLKRATSKTWKGVLIEKATTNIVTQTCLVRNRRGL